VSDKKTKQVAIGDGTESFSAVAVVAEIARGKDQRLKLAVFGFQALKRGDGDAVSTIEMVKSFKEFGFELRVGAAAR